MNNDNWLKYPEHVPKNYSWVLATISTHVDTWVETVAFFDGNFELPGRGLTKHVTHWMPIPEPAKS